MVYILKAKSEPPTLRIGKKLNEHLTEYSFEVKYWKDNDMKIADLLYGHPDNDQDSPNEVIPIPFVMKDILHENMNINNTMSMINIDNHEYDKYIMLTRRMTKIA